MQIDVYFTLHYFHDRRQTDRQIHFDSNARVTRKTWGRKETPWSAYYLLQPLFYMELRDDPLQHDRCFVGIRLWRHYRLIFMWLFDYLKKIKTIWSRYTGNIADRQRRRTDGRLVHSISITALCRASHCKTRKPSSAVADKHARRESIPKIAPIRRAYNVVDGLSSFV